MVSKSKWQVLGARVRDKSGGKAIIGVVFSRKKAQVLVALRCGRRVIKRDHTRGFKIPISRIEFEDGFHEIKIPSPREANLSIPA